MCENNNCEPDDNEDYAFWRRIVGENERLRTENDELRTSITSRSSQLIEVYSEFHLLRDKINKLEKELFIANRNLTKAFNIGRNLQNMHPDLKDKN